MKPWRKRENQQQGNILDQINPLCRYFFKLTLGNEKLHQSSEFTSWLSVAMVLSLSFCSLLFYHPTKHLIWQLLSSHPPTNPKGLDSVQVGLSGKTHTDFSGAEDVRSNRYIFNHESHIVLLFHDSSDRNVAIIIVNLFYFTHKK